MARSFSDIETQNKRKYLKAPTQAQIDSFIENLNVSESHFELFFNMPKGTIKVHRAINRDLPAKYWHIFFEADEIKKESKKTKKAAQQKQRTEVKKEPAESPSSRLAMLLS